MYERRDYRDGEVILAQGAVPTEFHVILSGEVEVVGMGADGLVVKFNELGAGESFGEEGLLTGRPRSASVIALGDVEVLAVDRGRFDALAHDADFSSEMARDIAKRVAKRLMALHDVSATQG